MAGIPSSRNEKRHGNRSQSN